MNLTVRLPLGSVLLLVALCLGCAQGKNQETRTPLTASDGLRDEMPDSCTVCVITVDSIGFLSDPYVSWRSSSIQSRRINGAGQILVAPAAEKEQVTIVNLRLDSISLLERAGDGPGEFRAIRSVAGYRGDSLLILESVKLSVVDDDSLRGRFFLLPERLQSFTVQSWQDTLILLNSYIPTTPPIAALNPAGQVMWQVDSVLPGLEDTTFSGDARQLYLLPTPRGGLVAIPRKYRFAVARCDSQGQRMMGPAPQPAWFEPWTPEDEEAASKADGSEAPLTYVLGANVDGEDRLWIVGRIADPRWKEAVNADGTIDWNRRLDGIVEVYDLATGRRLGAVRSDQFFFGLASDSVLYRIAEDSRGFPVIAFFRLRFDDGASRPRP